MGKEKKERVGPRGQGKKRKLAGGRAICQAAKLFLSPLFSLSFGGGGEKGNLKFFPPPPPFSFSPLFLRCFMGHLSPLRCGGGIVGEEEKKLVEKACVSTLGISASSDVLREKLNLFR